MFKRLKHIEARLRCLENDYYDHKNKYHDKRTKRIAERNELAKQILLADLQRCGEASCKDSITGANEMMKELYGDEWDKNDPLLHEDITLAALASLKRKVQF